MSKPSSATITTMDDATKTELGENLDTAPALCPNYRSGRVTFGVVADRWGSQSQWKSHVVMLDANCTLVDILDFPDDDDCTDWVIHGSYLEPNLAVIITHLEFANGGRDSGGKITQNLEFAFKYGDEDFSSVDYPLDYKHSGSECGCPSRYIIEEPCGNTGSASCSDDSAKKRQWQCSCPFYS